MAEGQGAIGRDRWAGLGVWLPVAAACTLLLWLLRGSLGAGHMALAYLLVVLGGSARHGRRVGLALSIGCFLAFNYFLLPPYYTLAIRDPLDWGVLVAFLVTGAVAAELFHRAQRAVEAAEARTRELDRLAAVGAESLSAPRAIDGVRAIARAVLGELSVRSCTVVVLEPPGMESIVESRSPSGGDGAADPGLMEYVVRERRVVGARQDGTSHVAPSGATLGSLGPALEKFTTLLVPLQVRQRVVGVLMLDDPAGLHVKDEQVRFTDALTHYAALAVERVRLTDASLKVEALREADLLKDALLASVSHDLRTPLTTIRALGSELLRATGDVRAVVIEEEADRLNRMVTDLLDLSRIRAGALSLEPQIIAAEDLVGAALQRLGGLPGADRIEVHIPQGERLPLGRFDFAHALRALCNLVENALRYSPPERSVEIEVREEADDLVFMVLDRGEGVPEAERERIFEPFFRGKPGPDPQRAGTGLGLAIARSVAEAQDGSVGYRPRPEGGSIFELRLPAATVGDVS